ncbi:MAG: hypothetical protein E7360_01310 [Clostridiales bacterium]|nr:hypothetical protein [Clostridiales bacterium]
MKKIYITVDTECHDINQVNSYIWGKVKDKEYGIKFILEQGKKYNIPINFFFDMCESFRYGQEYSKEIIETIRKYNQPIYLHIHPNYISGNDDKSFLWQYTKEEQKDILRKGFQQYCDLLGKEKCAAFRVGRYAACLEMYECLQELGVETIDLSYCYNNHKMCHLYFDEINVINRPKIFKGQTVLPNTRFVCLDFLGVKKSLNTDVHEATLQEIKEVLKEESLEHVVLTMHSWHFIDKAFYRKKIRGDKRQIKKFNKLIQYCLNKGFEFDRIENLTYRDNCSEELLTEKEINNCRGVRGKIKSLFFNFSRFQEIAKLNKKYFFIYAGFYSTIILALLILLIVLL